MVKKNLTFYSILAIFIARWVKNWGVVQWQDMRLWTVVSGFESLLPSIAFTPVAQLDRASDFGSEGWGFKSSRAYDGNSVAVLIINDKKKRDQIFLFALRK